MTPAFIEELDEEEQAREEEYDAMGEMCDPYKDLQRQRSENGLVRHCGRIDTWTSTVVVYRDLYN